jgi:hypothetical protein
VLGAVFEIGLTLATPVFLGRKVLRALKYCYYGKDLKHDLKKVTNEHRMLLNKWESAERELVFVNADLRRSELLFAKADKERNERLVAQAEESVRNLL